MDCCTFISLSSCALKEYYYPTTKKKTVHKSKKTVQKKQVTKAMPFDLNSYSKSMEFSLFQEFNKLPTLRLIHVSDVKKHQIKTDDLKCP